MNKGITEGRFELTAQHPGDGGGISVNNHICVKSTYCVPDVNMKLPAPPLRWPSKGQKLPSAPGASLQGASWVLSPRGQG